jgi:hypothetical protein
MCRILHWPGGAGRADSVNSIYTQVPCAKPDERYGDFATVSWADLAVYFSGNLRPERFLHGHRWGDIQ